MTPSSNNQNEPDKKPKTIYIVICATVLAVGGIAFLVATFFLNNFREPIAAGLSRTTGLKITVDSIGLNFTRGLGLRCGGVTVHTANGKKTLFSADKFIIQIEAIPLLHKQIIVKSSTLVNPVFPIHPRNAPKPAELQEHQPSPQSHGDKAGSKRPPLQWVREFLKNTNLTLNNIAVENGKILLLPGVAPGAQSKPRDLNFSLKLNILRPNPDRIDIALSSIALGLGPIKLNGAIVIDDMMSPGAKLMTKVMADRFTGSDLHQIREFLPENIQPILEQESFSGTFQNLSLKTDFPIETVTDLESMRRLASAEMTFNLDDVIVLLDKQSVGLPHTEFNLKWANNRLTHTMGGIACDGEFHLSGYMSPDSASFLDTDIDVTDIDLSKAKLSGEWMPRAGIVSGKLHLSVPESKALVWQGQLNVKQMALGKPEYHLANSVIKFKTQNEYTTGFDIQLHNITLGQAKLKQAVGTITASMKKIQLLQVNLFPEHGNIDLNGDYYPASKTYDLRFSGRKLSAEDLLPEYIEGPLELEGKLLQGKYAGHPLRGLSGSMRIKLADGSLRQLGLLTTLLTLLNPQSVVTAQKQGLNYSHLGGNFKIDRGVVTTADLELEGPQLNLLAAGRADLATEHLKGEIKAMPLQLVDTVVKIIPLLGKILTNKGGVVETYFEIEGTFSKPNFKFQTTKSILGKPVRVLEEVIKLPGSPPASGENNEGR